MKTWLFAATFAVGSLSSLTAFADETVEETTTSPVYDMLIMEPDAEVYFNTTGGSTVRADWSETAAANLESSFEKELMQQGLSLVDFDPDADRTDSLDQVLSLYEVVRASAQLNMPHKPKVKGKGAFNNEDLTLGATVQELGDIYGAKQALFIDHKSQIDSGGLIMGQILLGAATGVVMTTGSFRATIGTVVDLETGDIISRQQTAGGDSRNPNEAENLVGRITNKMTFAPTGGPAG